MTVREAIAADPFAWTVVALLAVVLLAGIWRGAEWLIKRLRERRRRALSLGEQPHDPVGCHMAGQPHLGPCRSGTVEPSEWTEPPWPP